MSNEKKIFVAGHLGMVGSAIVRILKAQGEKNIVTRAHNELDLTNQTAVNKFFEYERLDHVYLAAAKVGGIYANNNYPADFIYQNLMIAINVIDASFKNKVKKLLFLGSSCVYPRDAHQPMGEDALLTAKLESTNEPYAIAKIAGIKLCESYNRQYEKNYGVDYRSVIPTNLYGPGDNYHPENSHVIPALIQRFHEAKINNEKNVIIWGTGKAKREFLYVDDMAKACIHVLNIDKAIYDQQTAPMRSYLNIGSGQDLTIKELAEMIQVVVGYKGEINFDPTRPDGSPQKLMDSQCINNIGWKHETSLKDGLFLTYKNFIQSK